MGLVGWRGMGGASCCVFLNLLLARRGDSSRVHYSRTGHTPVISTGRKEADMT